MFGKYQAVFRSRWRALLWAGGVCLTAYCTVPHAGDPSAKNDADAQAEQQAVAALVEAAGGPAQDKPTKHVNPWAKQPASEQR
ncbi:hypothetical protein D2V17_05405 [Aurantiacibacter xanthus]|uniref:Uncharacterized protein n=1 Tax=Aurantiacibacter xanthus TaxID=1784712 RepID=A0A3A1P9V7_9SPHN|nr:hypothetical protein [Aurantiacibacter xanthus]RIV89708.1 hypothetical protein D2V17_05405 [Aurantiacibacter xanthus]